jgi:hypothetical protein
MKKWIESSVYDLVVATAADYRRMKRLMNEGNITLEQAVVFARRIAAVEHALIVACKGDGERVREAMLTDIAERRGFERSVSKKYYPARATFVRRKEHAVCLIAELLGLLEDGNEPK